MQWLTVKKAIYCAIRPWLWRALGLGIAPSIEHISAMRSRDFKTIVDVGANRGQFTLFARLFFPDAKIIAFEPLAAPADTFAHLFGGDGNVELKRTAVAEVTGTASIHVMTRDDSSSLLPPQAMQEEVFDVSAAGLEIIRTQRLGEALGGSHLARPALLKIDVQGSELAVLKGSSDMLQSFDAIFVECSYISLYVGQALATDIVTWLAGRGFSLCGVFNQYVDAKIGPVQADFLFLTTTKAIDPSIEGDAD